jgi:hypothetical protein
MTNYPTRRTGVIVGFRDGLTVTTDYAKFLADELRATFPGVTFAVVDGAQSVVFEYDEPTGVDVPPAPPVPQNDGERI